MISIALSGNNLKYLISFKGEVENILRTKNVKAEIIILDFDSLNSKIDNFEIPYEIVFLDINLGDETTAYHIAEELKRINAKIQLIFIGCCHYQAVEGYYYNVFRFIMKGINTEDEINKIISDTVTKIQNRAYDFRDTDYLQRCI